LGDFFTTFSHRSRRPARGFAHRVSGASDASAHAVSRRLDAVGDIIHDIGGLVRRCLIVILLHYSFQKIKESFQGKGPSMPRAVVTAVP
jgi:hypothetical protein